MSFKRNTTKPKPETKRKNILSLIAQCFKGSPVKLGEDELLHARKGEKKKLKLPSFPWAKFKKKKKKKTVPFDLQSVSSSFSLFSSNGVSTPKASSSKRWCKRKQKTPSDPPSSQIITNSTTTTPTLHSTNQTVPQSGPTHNLTQSTNQTNRPGLIRRAIHRTASSHHMARTARLKLGAGLWVMVTSLGVMLVLGRAGAVLFLCSCWYVVPMVMED